MVATLLCSALGDSKDTNERKLQAKLIANSETMRMSLSVYLKTFVQTLKQSVQPRSKQNNEAKLAMFGRIALILGEMTLSEHLSLKFKTNYIQALKTSIHMVQILDKSVTNFYSLMENLAMKTVTALHNVDQIESVKGGILMASQILKLCDSLTTF